MKPVKELMDKLDKKHKIKKISDVNDYQCNTVYKWQEKKKRGGKNSLEPHRWKEGKQVNPTH